MVDRLERIAYERRMYEGEQDALSRKGRSRHTSSESEKLSKEARIAVRRWLEKRHPEKIFYMSQGSFEMVSRTSRGVREGYVVDLIQRWRDLRRLKSHMLDFADSVPLGTRLKKVVQVLVVVESIPMSVVFEVVDSVLHDLPEDFALIVGRLKDSDPPQFIYELEMKGLNPVR